jgi:hypothetical protein
VPKPWTSSSVRAASAGPDGDAVPCRRRGRGVGRGMCRCYSDTAPRRLGACPTFIAWGCALSAAAGTVQLLAQHAVQAGGVHGFGEVGVHARGQQRRWSSSKALAVSATMGASGTRRPRGSVAWPPAPMGHLHVHQQQVVGLPGGHVPGHLAIRRQLGCRPACLSSAADLGADRVVLGHQHPAPSVAGPQDLQARRGRVGRSTRAAAEAPEATGRRSVNQTRVPCAGRSPGRCRRPSSAPAGARWSGPGLCRRGAGWSTHRPVRRAGTTGVKLRADPMPLSRTSPSSHRLRLLRRGLASGSRSPALRRELDRVVDQVEQHLLEAGIADDRLAGERGSMSTCSARPLAWARWADRW